MKKNKNADNKTTILRYIEFMQTYVPQIIATQIVALKKW